MRRHTYASGLALVLLACGGGAAAHHAADSLATASDSATRGFQPPVATNAESPVRYPPELYREKAEGTVLLHLYVDAHGRIVPESTRVAESSGTPGLDSAALAGVPAMRFAPARRDGVPVATAFLQPVHFRHPEGAHDLGGTNP